MRLTINGEPVTFRLEGERTLGDVATGIERWLADDGFVTVAIAADGEGLPPGPAAPWRERPVGDVGAVEVEARRLADLRREHWQAAAGLLATLAAVLDDGGSDAGALAAAVEALDAINLGTVGAAAPSPAGAAAARLGALIDRWPAAGPSGWTPARRGEAAAAARELAGLLADLAARAADAPAAVAAAAAGVAGMLPGLAGVAVQLQAGHDREAMAVVTGLCDAMQRLLPLVPFLPRDDERERLVAALNGVLRDLAAALEAGDTVLVGDLAEYEVAPRLAALLPRLGGPA